MSNESNGWQIISILFHAVAEGVQLTRLLSDFLAWTSFLSSHMQAVLYGGAFSMVSQWKCMQAELFKTALEGKVRWMWYCCSLFPSSAATNKRQVGHLQRQSAIEAEHEGLQCHSLQEIDVEVSLLRLHFKTVGISYSNMNMPGPSRRHLEASTFWFSLFALEQLPPWEAQPNMNSALPWWQPDCCGEIEVLQSKHAGSFIRLLWNGRPTWPTSALCLLSWLRMLHGKWHGIVRVRTLVCYK